jgi:hypothetical protein
MKIGFAKSEIIAAIKIPVPAPGDKPLPEVSFTDRERKLLNISDKMVRQLVNAARGHQRVVVQPLELAVLYGEEGGRPFAWLAFDLCEEGFKTLDAMREPLVKKLDIPADRILVTYTHAHMGFSYDLPKLQEIILSTVQKARESMAEAEMGMLNLFVPSRRLVINRRVAVEGIGSHTLIFNDDCNIKEDSFDATGQVAEWIKDLGGAPRDFVHPGQKIIPSGPVDDSLQTLVFREKGTEKVIGSFIRFACHPVIVSGLRVKGDISADFPGYLKRKLEDKLGGIALFGQGPSGDLKPLNSEYSHAFARKFGENLADFILAEFKNVRWELLTTLRFAIQPVTLPLRQDLLPDAAAAEEEMARVEALYDKATHPANRRRLQNRSRLCCYVRDDLGNILRPEWKQSGKIEIALSALRCNDTVILASPGEVFLQTGREMIQPFADRHPVVVSVANENISYLVPPEDFNQGGYEPSVCLADPAHLPNLVTASHRLLQEMYSA